jgi:hypothetical protein
MSRLYNFFRGLQDNLEDNFSGGKNYPYFLLRLPVDKPWDVIPA